MTLPESKYLETRNGGWYVTGSRIGLHVVVQAFRRGKGAEDIFRAFPSIGSLAVVYGVLTYILEHPSEIDAYLNEEDRRYAAFVASHPLPPEMLEPFERAQNEKESKIA
jgi:hypothetical protein